MSSANSMTIIGQLTADPELRYTQNGKAVANFSIASDDRRFNKQTNQYEKGDTLFMRAILWGDHAEHFAHTLRRGDRVIALGTVKQGSYDNKDGQKVTYVELQVDEIGPTLRFTAFARPDHGSEPAMAGASASGDWAPATADGESWGDPTPF